MYKRNFIIDGRGLEVNHPDSPIDDSMAARAFCRVWSKIKNARLTIDEAKNLLDKYEVKAGK
jgi:hypothetical protein